MKEWRERKEEVGEGGGGVGRQAGRHIPVFPDAEKDVSEGGRGHGRGGERLVSEEQEGRGEAVVMREEQGIKVRGSGEDEKQGLGRRTTRNVY